WNRVQRSLGCAVQERADGEMRAELGNRPTGKVREADAEGDLVGRAGLKRRDERRFDVFAVAWHRVGAVDRICVCAHVAVAAEGRLAPKPIVRDGHWPKSRASVQIIGCGDGRIEPRSGGVNLAEEI